MLARTTQKEPELLAQHRDLMCKIAELRTWWSQVDELGKGPRYAEMGGSLIELREVLAAHFADEERGGYLAPALKVASQFTQLARDLQQQHQVLLESLDRLAARLSTCNPPFTSWIEARDAFEAFLTQLREHETAENRIVQSAFAEDVGTVD